MSIQLGAVVDALKPADHKRLAEFVEQYAGIQLPESKRSLIEARLKKRLRVTGHDRFHDYIEHVLSLDSGQSEQSAMIDALTTNKTDFYREPDHFQILNEYLTAMGGEQRWHGTTPLRVWSAGCSSGEEPYTLALELLEYQRQFPRFQFSIAATDISEQCLRHAARGIYQHDLISPVPLALRRRYLLRSPDRSKVLMAPEVQQHIKFRHFNLLRDRYPGADSYDVIFCRNVMIYFSLEDRRRITTSFAHCLHRDGMLFIGHSESLDVDDAYFKRFKPTVYQKQASAR